MVYTIDMFSQALNRTERIAYVNSVFIARMIATFLYGPNGASAVRRVSDRDLIRDYSLFRFRACLHHGKASRILAYFDSEQTASFFVDFFSSVYPGLKIIIDEYGMRTPSLDKESALF